MKVLFSAVAAFALMVIPAAANPTHNWSGVYLGAHAGYAWGNVDVRDTNGGVLPGPFSYDTSGGFGGGTVGANWQLGSVVVGVEGDLGFMDLSGAGIIPSSVPTAHQDITLDGGLYGDITGRLGFALGRTFVYGKGGWAYFDGDAKQVTTNPGYTPTSTGAFNGWVYGGGLEYMLNECLSMKVEYLHYQFGEQGGAQTSVSDPPIGFVYTNEHQLDADSVKIGLNYRFGGDNGSLK